jgi:hypothetical protein
MEDTTGMKIPLARADVLGMVGATSSPAYTSAVPR